MNRKLEKLKAMIRMAVHPNSNNNEANLAARTVCKWLAEGNFDIVEKQPDRVRSASNPTPNQGARTWNDVKRSTESAWRSNWVHDPPPGPSPFEDFLKNHFRGRGSWSGFDWAKAPHKDAPEPDDSWDRETKKANPYSGSGPEYVRYNPFTPDDREYDWDPILGRVRRKRPSETRKCSKCGLEVSTFRLKEDPFVCNPCHWKEAL